LCVGGGIGITPLFSLAYSGLYGTRDEGGPASSLVLLWVVKKLALVVSLQSHVERLVRGGCRIQIHCTSVDDDQSALVKTIDDWVLPQLILHMGRPDLPRVFRDTRGGGSLDVAVVGPPSLVQDCYGAARAASDRDGAVRIHCESFGV
ncbi:hypothetical protein HDU91_006919, partial [Kappamyces sp. JEL0680]